MTGEFVPFEQPVAGPGGLSGAPWGRRPAPPRRGMYIAIGVTQLVLTGALALLWALYALVESASTATGATYDRVNTFVNFGPFALGISFLCGIALLAVSGSWRGRGLLRSAVAWTDAAVLVGLVAVGLVLYLRTRGA